MSLCWNLLGKHPNLKEWCLLNARFASHRKYLGNAHRKYWGRTLESSQTPSVSRYWQEGLEGTYTKICVWGQFPPTNGLKSWGTKKVITSEWEHIYKCKSWQNLLNYISLFFVFYFIHNSSYNLHSNHSELSENNWTSAFLSSFTCKANQVWIHR